MIKSLTFIAYLGAAMMLCGVGAAARAAARIGRKPFALLVAGAFALAGCTSAQITNLQSSTTALVNFNNALISIDVAIIGDIQSQARALAPLVCGGVSLGNVLLAQPAIATAVNAALKSKQAQTTGARVQITATALCQAAGLSATVTATPPTPAAGG